MKYDYSILNSRMWNKLIDDWILNERDRVILKRRIIDGVKYEKLAEEFDLSVIQIVRIVNKHRDDLFRIIMVVTPIEE